MIAGLRRRHTMVVAAIALIVPPTVWLAVTNRDVWPISDVPSNVSSSWGDTTSRLPDAEPVAVQAVPAESGDPRALAVAATLAFSARGERQLTLMPQADFAEADLLVYWHPRNSEHPVATVPDTESLLLGPLGGRGGRFALPPTDATSDGGTVLLYSLGQRLSRGRIDIPAVGAGDPR